tara:strand:+ start:2188 stop:4635 length:2448 start_codon:yes stop_codon:yes gene_type:complete
MASFKECVSTIRQAAPNLSEQQAQELFDEVHDIYDGLKADGNVADLEAELTRAVEKRVGEEERAAINEKRMRALNYKTRMRFIQKLRQVPDEDVPRFLESILAGEYGNSPYKTSIERTYRALERDTVSVFLRDIEKEGLDRSQAISFLRRSENGELLMRESYEPGSTGNDTARIISEAMENANERLRKMANKRGADIARIPGYLVKQTHDNIKINRAGVQQWTDDILPLLDEERTFGVRGLDDAAKRKHLESSWETLLKGRRDDSIKDLSEPPGYKGPGNLAKKLGHHRSLHFKDGQSAWKYMKDYGLPDVGTSFIGGVDMMSRNIAALQHLGPNPEYMLKEFIQRAKLKLGAKKEGKINADYINLLYQDVTGVGSILPQYDTKGWRMARGMNLAKNLSNAALLGGTVITSLADLGTAAVRLNEIGVSFFKAHTASLDVFTLRGRRSGELREVADSIGLGMDSLISGVQSRWTGNDGINGQGAHLVSTVMRVTGMNWLNDTMKTSVVLTLSNYIAKQAGKTFDEIHPQLRREMAGYGITADDFAAITAAVRDLDGKKYVDLDEIADRDIAARAQEFFGGFADSAVLTPGARTNVLIRGGKRGEPFTEMRMAFFNLKSYSIAFYQDILSRTWSSGGAGVGIGLHLVLSMTVYGHIANLFKDLAAGKEPREVTVESFPKVFMDAFLTAGGLGFYGDLMIGALGEQRMGKGFAEAVGGPVLGNAIRSLRALGDLGEYALGDDEALDRAAYKGLRTVKQMIPGANIFYTRQALDYLVWWEMAEYLRPGWAQNFEERVREETGQEFYRKPTESVYGGLLN